MLGIRMSESFVVAGARIRKSKTAVKTGRGLVEVLSFISFHFYLEIYMQQVNT